MGLSDAQEVYNLLEGKRIPVLYRNGKADRVGIWKVLTDTYKTRGRSCYENGVLCFSSLSPQPSTSVTGSKGGWSMTELKKVGDLEKLRERFLPKEFENYRTSSQKWLPAPGVLLTPAAPPIASAILAAIARPSPVPP